MKHNIYSLFDSAAEAYTQPFFLMNDGIALRMFIDNVNAEEQTNITQHPDHFTLFKIGEWDDSEGKIIPITPVSLGNGAQFKNKMPEHTYEYFKEIFEQIKQSLEQIENTVDYNDR